MAHKRTDNLMDQALVQTLNDIEQDLQQLKSPAPQYIGGANIVSYLSDSGNAYDWSGTVTHTSGVPNFGSATFIVSATARTMSTLYANLMDNLFVGSSTAAYRPIDYLNDEAANNIAFLTSYVDLPSPSAASATRSWAVFVNGDIRKTIYLKFYIQALDLVDITVTRFA